MKALIKLKYHLYIIRILPEFIFTREKIIKVVIYHWQISYMSEDVLVLTTNIAVILDENSVLKMDYELTEKDYSLFV